MDINNIVNKFSFLNFTTKYEDGCHWFLDLNYNGIYKQINFSKYNISTLEQAKLKAIKLLLFEGMELIPYYKNVNDIDKLNFRYYLKNIDETDWLDIDEYKEIFSEFKSGYPIVKLLKDNLTISEYEFLKCNLKQSLKITS